MATQCGRCGRIELGPNDSDRTGGVVIFDVLTYCDECAPIAMPKETVKSVLRAMIRIMAEMEQVQDGPMSYVEANVLILKMKDLFERHVPRLKIAIKRLRD